MDWVGLRALPLRDGDGGGHGGVNEVGNADERAGLAASSRQMRSSVVSRYGVLLRY